MGGSMVERGSWSSAPASEPVAPEFAADCRIGIGAEVPAVRRSCGRPVRAPRLIDLSASQRTRQGKSAGHRIQFRVVYFLVVPQLYLRICVEGVCGSKRWGNHDSEGSGRNVSLQGHGCTPSLTLYWKSADSGDLSSR